MDTGEPSKKGNFIHLAISLSHVEYSKKVLSISSLLIKPHDVAGSECLYRKNDLL